VIREGMQIANAAISLDASDEGVHANLFFLLWASGNHDGAIREGKTAHEFNPNSIWSNLALGIALGYSGAEFYENAMEHLNLVIRLGPRDVGITWAHTNLASASFISKNTATRSTTPAQHFDTIRKTELHTGS